jgi:hypothetical protein
VSGETQSNVSAWTIDSLHSHLVTIINERDRRYEQRFEDQEKAVIAALAATQRAIEKAEEAAQHEFALLNELRAVVVNRDATFITRNEADAAIKNVANEAAAANARTAERILEISERLQGVANRAETVSAYAGATKRIETLESATSEAKGKGAGVNSTVIYLLNGLGIVAALLTIYFTLRGR